MNQYFEPPDSTDALLNVTSYDLIWTLHPDRSFTVESELCPGLDVPVDDEDEALSESFPTSLGGRVLVKQP